jgi:AraC family transcriptional regulator, regulatory protein of adaptative response / methylphosphotriester-DNA alkyltransferase methyltransferase
MLPQKLPTRKEEIATEMLRLVDEHIEELMNGKVTRRMSASDLAAKLFIAPRHLTNTIKAVTGRSPCDIMEQRIMAEATKLLSETELSVAEIGYKFGYTEPTNFTKFFKGMCGVTPLNYRKSQIKAA